jgi:hypothetical protein
MAYYKAKLKSSGDRASPCYRPFWIGKLSHKCLSMWTLLYVSFILNYVLMKILFNLSKLHNYVTVVFS